MSEKRYRVGRKLGRTIYRDDELIGVMDRTEDALMIVELLNSGPADETIQPWTITTYQGELRGYVDADNQQYFRKGLTDHDTPIGWRALYVGEASPA